MFTDQVVDHFIHYLHPLFLSDASMKTIVYMSSVKKDIYYKSGCTWWQEIRSEWVGLTLGFSYRASFKYYDKGYQQMPLSFVMFLYLYVSSLHVSGLYQPIIRGIPSCCLFVTTWFMYCLAVCPRASRSVGCFDALKDARYEKPNVATLFTCFILNGLL